MSIVIKRQQTGFTLIELMVSLIIMAAIATVLVQSSAGLQDQSRYDQTVDRVNQIKQAALNTQTVNGVPIVSGFVADIGRLPNSISELLSYIPCSDHVSTTQAACTANTATWTNLWQKDTTSVSGLGYGWNGPYIQTTQSPSSDYAFTDGWGNTIGGDNVYYGWRNYSTANNYLTLQSYGSDGLQSPSNTTDYTADYPSASCSNSLYTDQTSCHTNGGTWTITPIIQPKDWLIDLSHVSGISSVTVNLSRSNYIPNLYIASSLSATCGLLGGTAAPGICNINQTMCGVLAGTWNAGIATCTLTALPLQSLCTNAGGYWVNATTSCTLAMDSGTCLTLTGAAPTTPGQCTLVSNTSTGVNPATLSDTCQNQFFNPSNPGAWNAGTSSCNLSGAMNINDVSGICNSLASNWNTTSNQCTFGPPLLPTTSQICLNIYYRNSRNVNLIELATATANVQNNGQAQSVNFSGFSVYDTAGNLLVDGTLNPVPVPAGQNAISITLPNNNGICDGTPTSYYPPARSAPIPQTFVPGATLVFNW